MGPLLGHRGLFSSWGDLAATELAVRNAVHLHQTLGPYDRFGWHHPGPMLFYLLAIPYAAVGSRGQGLLVGAGLVNLGAGVAIVAVIGRRAGAAAAFGAAAAVSVTGVLLGVPNLTSAWSPVLLVLPMALLAVLSADWADRGGWALVGAVAVGSLLVQTEVATAPMVAAVLGLAGVGRLASGRRGRPGPGPVSVLTAAGLWAPAVWQQASGRPGNLTLLTDFFLGGRGHHGPLASWSALGAGMLLVPARHRLGVDVGAAGVGDWGLVVVLVVAGGLAAWGWRHRDRGGLALGLTGLPLGGAAAEWLSLQRAPGPIQGYLVLCTAGLTLSAALGAVVVLSDGRGWLRPALAVTAAVTATGWLSTAALAFDPGPGYRMVGPATTATEALLGPGRWPVMVCIGSASGWPSAAGVIVNLRRAGWDVRVGRQWTYLLGDGLAPDGREAAAVFLDGVSAPAPFAPGGTMAVSSGGDLTVAVFRPDRAPVSPSICPTVPQSSLMPEVRRSP